MSIIKGDIKKAIGICDIKVNGLNIDLSKTTAEDVTTFQLIPLDVIGSKKKEELSAKDLSLLNQKQNEWFVKYFMDKDPSLDIEEIKKLVVFNKRLLQKEFTIAFNIKTREQYDKDELEAETETKKLKNE